VKEKILEILKDGPMTPKKILAACQTDPRSSFDEISNALFGLMRDCEIEVNWSKEFYIPKEKGEE